MAAIGRGVEFHQYRKGWHPTATLGVFAAAAACVRLMALSVERTAAALAIAASMASGIKANFGTMTKPLHVGLCTRDGLLAARLASLGYTADESALEHHQGYLDVYNGAGNYRVEAILEGWADPFDAIDPGVAIKAYPCCASTHSAIDAMLALREAHALSADDAAGVDVQVYERRLTHTNRPRPRGNLEAKFSVQYCVARALVDGAVGLEHFEGDAYRDPAVRAVADRVASRAHHDPEHHFSARVRVERTDGELLETWVRVPSGRGPGNPLPPERLHAKFVQCAGRVLPHEQVEALARCLSDLPSLADIRHLMRLLAPPPSSSISFGSMRRVLEGA